MANTEMPKSGDKKKNRGKVVEKYKEEIDRMVAASMSRQQGRSNLTSKDLSPKAKGGSATVKEAPNGKEYMGPAYGEYKAKKKEDKPKPQKDTKPRQRPGAGREAMMAKMEEERKRRQRGESAVVGG